MNPFYLKGGQDDKFNKYFIALSDQLNVDLVICFKEHAVVISSPRSF